MAASRQVFNSSITGIAIDSHCLFFTNCSYSCKTKCDNKKLPMKKTFPEDFNMIYTEYNCTDDVPHTGQERWAEADGVYPFNSLQFTPPHLLGEQSQSLETDNSQTNSLKLGHEWWLRKILLSLSDDIFPLRKINKSKLQLRTRSPFPKIDLLIDWLTLLHWYFFHVENQTSWMISDIVHRNTVHTAHHPEMIGLSRISISHRWAEL